MILVLQAGNGFGGDMPNNTARCKKFNVASRLQIGPPQVDGNAVLMKNMGLNTWEKQSYKACNLPWGYIEYYFALCLPSPSFCHSFHLFSFCTIPRSFLVIQSK